MTLKEKYGKVALVAGASEGLGAAFATYLAKEGMELVLIARRKEPLQKLADELNKTYNVQVTCITADLSVENTAKNILQQLGGKEINLLVYNAALPYIGAFEKSIMENNTQMATANMITPMHMVHVFGEKMLQKKQGAVILMASLAGFQGSGFLAVYAATKAFNRVLAESLWYEWKNRGVDVIACCAGATATPNYVNTQPEKTSFLTPKAQQPAEVVNECFRQLGKKPSFVTGMGNKIVSFIMQKLMTRKTAINTMGDTTRKMYRL